MTGQTEAAQALRQDLLRLGLPDDDLTVDRLVAYLGLLERWNSAYNLTAIRDPEAMRVQHVIDCLAVIPALRRRLVQHRMTLALSQAGGSAGPIKLGASDDPLAGLRVLDVGSGGGLPGVVLAIVEPGWTVRCIDAVAKKAAFVRQVAGELRLPNLEAIHGRVQTLKGPPGHGLIVSRAFASLSDFTAWSRGALAPNGLWAAMKGKPPTDEERALPAQHVQVLDVESIKVPGLDADRCIVWMNTSDQTL